MDIEFKFTPTNLDEIKSRVTSFIGSIISGTGGEELKKVAEQVVKQEYADAFARGGFPGNQWKSINGPVSLQRRPVFKFSFQDNLQFQVKSGSAVLTIKFANGYTHPRMDEPYIAALRHGISRAGGGENFIELDIAGKVGGISKSGANSLFRSFRQIVSKEASRAGY